MTESTILAIVAGFTMCFCTIFPALAQGKTATAAMEGIARQPAAAGDMRSSLIVAMALMEALAIYGMLVAFMILNMAG